MISEVDVSGRNLDNGCGIGLFCERLPEADIVGLDISAEMLRVAGTKSDRALLADSQNIPFADETFDTIFARSLIHHLPDPERGISEMDVRLACYENALAAYGQSGQMSEDDWLNPMPVDQRTLYAGNSILRGGREPVIAERVAGGPLDELEIE